MGFGQGAGRDHLRLMEADTALANYEAARPRLPSTARPGACRKAADLSEIADRFDTFLLDAFGVLNIGDAAIPGVPARIDALRAAGKRVLVLTNAASVPHAALVAKYARLGYDFAAEDVVTSRQVLMDALDIAPGETWGVMAPRDLQGDDLDHLPLAYLGDDAKTYGAVDGFVLLGSGGWSEARQALLETALHTRARPVWVGNPDIVAPRESGFSVEPGYYAHRLADRTGIAPRFFGKPFGNIFDHAFARLDADLDLSRTLMVGDSLHTDVLGGQAAGIASALISGYGFFERGWAQAAITRTGIAPDYILAAP